MLVRNNSKEDGEWSKRRKVPGWTDFRGSPPKKTLWGEPQPVIAALWMSCSASASHAFVHFGCPIFMFSGGTGKNTTMQRGGRAGGKQQFT